MMAALPIPPGAARPLIGVIGDFNASNPRHRLTGEALVHAGAEHAWVGTDEIGSDPHPRLRRFDGLLIASGSPYRSMDGAITAIRYARERGVPLVGT